MKLYRCINIFVFLNTFIAFSYAHVDHNEIDSTKCRTLGENSGQEALDTTVSAGLGPMEQKICTNYRKDPATFNKDLYSLERKDPQVIINKKTRCSCIKDKLKKPLSDKEKMQIKKFVHEEQQRIELMNVSERVFKVMQAQYLHELKHDDSNKSNLHEDHEVDQNCKSVTSIFNTLKIRNKCNKKSLSKIISVARESLPDCIGKNCSEEQVLKMYNKAMNKDLDAFRKGAKDNKFRNELDYNSYIEKKIKAKFTSILKQKIEDPSANIDSQMNDLQRELSYSLELGPLFKGNDNKNKLRMYLSNMIKIAENSKSYSGKSEAIKQAIEGELQKEVGNYYPRCDEVIENIEGACEKHSKHDTPSTIKININDDEVLQEMDERFNRVNHGFGFSFQKYICKVSSGISRDSIEQLGVEFVDSNIGDIAYLVRPNRENLASERFRIQSTEDRIIAAGGTATEIEAIHKGVESFVSSGRKRTSMFSRTRTDKSRNRSKGLDSLERPGHIESDQDNKRIEATRESASSKQEIAYRPHNEIARQTIASQSSNPSAQNSFSSANISNKSNQVRTKINSPQKSAKDLLQAQVDQLKSSLARQRKEMENIKESKEKELKQIELDKLEAEIQEKKNAIQKIKKEGPNKPQDRNNFPESASVENSRVASNIGPQSSSGKNVSGNAASNVVSNITRGSGGSSVESDFVGTPTSAAGSNDLFPDSQVFSNINNVVKTISNNESKRNASFLELVYKNTKPSDDEIQKQQSELKKIYETYITPIPAGDGYFVLNKNADETIGILKISKEKYNEEYKNITLKEGIENKSQDLSQTEDFNGPRFSKDRLDLELDDL